MTVLAEENLSTALKVTDHQRKPTFFFGRISVPVRVFTTT